MGLNSYQLAGKIIQHDRSISLFGNQVFQKEEKTQSILKSLRRSRKTLLGNAFNYCYGS